MEEKYLLKKLFILMTWSGIGFIITVLIFDTMGFKFNSTLMTTIGLIILILLIPVYFIGKNVHEKDVTEALICPRCEKESTKMIKFVLNAFMF